MLKLKDISKIYSSGDLEVRALNNVNLAFRKNEFVSILGQSGCGKTTMLNIIGGLDRYTDGDLFINGISTKEFSAADWDAYRNHSIGFVFQSYNLIPHLTVEQNVELALTLSGVSNSERKQRVKNVIEKVGLINQINKMPNQLSGGQMQRVSIARALINDPEIILADEPTGALDSVTSIQISDLLKEIASDRLVIMVTHNKELADKYSTRIVQLLDGEVISDSNPFTFEEESEEIFKLKARDAEEILNKSNELNENEPKASKRRWWQFYKRKVSADGKIKTSMSFFTALGLSFRNILTKKGRTILTAIAGSIGIIGVALVLCVSNGFSNYISKMQSDILSGYPLEIGSVAIDASAVMKQSGETGLEQYPDGDNIYVDDMKIEGLTHINFLTDEYVEYVKNMDMSWVNNIQYTSAVQMNVISKTDSGEYKQLAGKTDDLLQILGAKGKFGSELLSNSSFLKSQYDILGDGTYPEKATDIALVVDNYNRIPVTVLDSLGIDYSDKNAFKFSDLVGRKLKLISNDDYYVRNSQGLFDVKTPDETMYKSGTDLTITCIMRVNEKAPLSLLSRGIAYLPSLSEKVLEDNKNSQITKAQKASTEKSVLSSCKLPGFFDFNYTDPYTGSVTVVPKKLLEQTAMQIAGVTRTPYSIAVYPKDFESKEQIKDYLNKYNGNLEETDVNYIKVSDQSELVTSTMTTLVSTISYVLIAFASISLIVSSVMIGIITYASVVERTKEIGILRSIGARKRDISRVFNAETMIIGFTAGIIGVLIAFILTFPISAIISALSGGMATGMAIMNPIQGLVLIAISVCLTFIAGLIPSRMASKKDPVVALRS